MTGREDVDEEYNTLRMSDERKSWPYRSYRGLQALFEGEASTKRAGSIEVSFKGGLAGGLENEAYRPKKE